MKRLARIALGLIGVILTTNASSQTPSATISPERFYIDALLLAKRERKVTFEEVQRELLENKVILLDLRSPEEYRHKHLRGATSLPVGEITDASLQRVVGDKERAVVIYCEQQLIPTRRIALTTLGYPTIVELGYKNVRVLEDLWRKSDDPRYWEESQEAPSDSPAPN